jgi:hypothetical protein
MVNVKNPGDIITIKVEGVEYETYIDPNGTQRFHENPGHPILQLVPIITVPSPYGPYETRDLNALRLKYANKEFSQREYAEANMALGYSLSGFGELSCFFDMRIENPLNPCSVEHDEVYLFGCVESGKMSRESVVNIIMNRDGITQEEAEDYVSEYV